MEAIDSPYDDDGNNTNWRAKPRKKIDPAVARQETDAISLMMPTVANPVRGIQADVYAFFGVRHRLDPNGQIVHTYYPYTKDGNVTGYKCRVDATKDFFSAGDTQGSSLFGITQASTGSAKVFVTEGEEDAIALWSAIWSYQAGGEFEGNAPSVVSLPHGAEPPNMTEADTQLFDQCKEIILVLDNDEAGSEGIKQLTKLLPIDKVKVVQLPLKDASDMLQAGRGKELAEAALFRGQDYRPTTIVDVQELLHELTIPASFGWSWPWKELTDMTYGIHPGRIYGVGGGVGSSKTMLAHHIIECLVAQGISVGAIMLEETATECVRAVAGIKDKAVYDRPDIPYDTDTLLQTASGLDSFLYLGRDGEIDDVEQCVELIKFMVMLRGARAIIVDPISDLVAGVSATVGNEKLNWFFKTLEDLAMSLNFAVIVTSHLNPRKGIPHEEGGPISLADMTGSRALMRKSSVCFGIERNSKAVGGLELYNKIVKLKGRGCNPLVPGVFFTRYDTSTGIMLPAQEPEGGLTEKKESVKGLDTSSWGGNKEAAYPDDTKPPWED